YNQPTGQFYHLAADNRFPYWIYSGQQDNGTVGIASRSDYGALSYREWHPVGGDERDYDVPDPSDPDTIYVSGLGGNLGRFDARTGQVVSIDPGVESSYARRANEVKYHYTWFTPIAVSPRPPHSIFQASQYLFRSDDRGHSWKTVSPDLSGAVPGTKGCEGAITLQNAGPCGFGVIFTIALSPRTDDEIWIGTDNGRIDVTRDGGKTWSDVTPKGIAPWSKIATLDISPIDPATVYAAVDTHRLDDFSPHAYATHDGGRTWKAITGGFPGDDFVQVVRADPVRRGLLYAGTNSGVFVSFDDGARWQPLKLNLPTAWVGDLLVHGNDLVAATQGRAIWVLDDVSPLRELAGGVPEAAAHLFAPADAFRLRRDENRDTPLPPETPLGPNPPAGAVLDYVLPSGSGGPISIEILDARGERVRGFSSDDSAGRPPAERYFSEAWTRPEPLPPTSAGHHRFVWDLRGDRPKATNYDYSIAAIWGDDTPIEPDGPLVPPGRYTVKLTAGGKSWSQPLTLRMDPRVHATPEDLASQYDVARQAARLMNTSFAALQDAKDLQKGKPSDSAAALAGGKKGFASINVRATAVFRAVESGDAAPTLQAVAELESARADFERLLTVLKGIRH
ncbi:MAG: WD40/YVTN/BNR-like repeat-containing protein, partial [Thermoanaerobaculia bacterium]